MLPWEVRKCFVVFVRRRIHRIVHRHFAGIPIKDQLNQLDLQLGPPATYVYASLLRQCDNARALSDVKRVHEHIIRNGYHQSTHLGNLLIQMYRRCGSLGDARAVFERMPKRDVVSWSSMIAAYAQLGHCRAALELYHKMDVEPNEITYVSTLAACSGVGDLAEGKAVHARIIARGMQNGVFVETALVNMYAKCGSLDEARRVFDGMQQRDVVSWTAMIAAYAQNGHCKEAFELYRRMDSAHVEPNAVTLTSILSACCSKGALAEGKEIHLRVIAKELQHNVAVQNALANMYAKCGNLDDALRIFEAMQHRDHVSWNSMIAAFVQHRHCKEAVELFHRMHLEGVKPDSVTYLGVIGACSNMGLLQRCQAVHIHLNSTGFQADVAVQNALVSMYAKCGSLDDAKRVFEQMNQRNVVSWTAIITAYTQHGHGKEALELYHRMTSQAVVADNITLIAVICACSTVGSLDESRKTHAQFVACSPSVDVLVENALINMYSKCGSLDDAREVFDRMQQRNLVSWNAMMGAYVQHGHDEDAVELFQQMELEPDNITIVILLCAYANLGALAEGKLIHARLLQHAAEGSSKPDVIVGNALLSMYARCGSLKDAREVFEGIEHKDVVSWSSVIAGYSHHGHGEDGIELYQKMHLVGVQPDNVTFVSILNSCSHAGLLEGGHKFFISMVADHHIVPLPEHYKCMIDLLGRAGWLSDAEELLENMPFQPDAVAWVTLLGSCKLHGDVERGARAAKFACKLDPKFTGSHVLLSNIYAAAGNQEGVADVRMSMNKKSLMNRPGYSFLSSTSVQKVSPGHA